MANLDPTYPRRDYGWAHSMTTSAGEPIETGTLVSSHGWPEVGSARGR
jgi:hypothetical protein